MKIRTTAVLTQTPIMTTISSARAAALGIAALKRELAAIDREMQALLKRSFKKVANVKPPSSRADSSEKFVVAMGFRGHSEDPRDADEDLDQD